MKHLSPLPLLLLVASSALACSSSGNNASPGGSGDAATPGTDSATPVADSGASDAAKLALPRISAAPIIEHHCVFCHGPTADGGVGSGIAFGQLDMTTADTAYPTNLVNVLRPHGGESAESSMVRPPPPRVVPGDSTTSLLYDK